MKKVQGSDFINSETCYGTSFATDAPLDVAHITIKGRYPETGWARNLLSHEIVEVRRGIGSLAIRDSEEIALQEGDIVHVPPQNWFAWSGDMTLTMACSPPFTPEQYEIEEA